MTEYTTELYDSIIESFFFFNNKLFIKILHKINLLSSKVCLSNILIVINYMVINNMVAIEKIVSL